LPGDPGGADRGAVHDHVGVPGREPLIEYLVQVRGLGGEHGDALVQIPVGGGDADAGVGGQPGDRGGIPEPAQYQHRLPPHRQGAPAAAGAAGGAFLGQQPGRVPADGLGDVEAGTIGDHGGPFWSGLDLQQIQSYQGPSARLHPHVQVTENTSIGHSLSRQPVVPVRVHPSGRPSTVASPPVAVMSAVTGPRRSCRSRSCPQRPGRCGATASLRSGTSGCSPRNARTSSSGAAAAHACGEQDVGYGTGGLNSAREKPQNSSGSRPPNAVAASSRPSASRWASSTAPGTCA